MRSYIPIIIWGLIFVSGCMGQRTSRKMAAKLNVPATQQAAHTLHVPILT